MDHKSRTLRTIVTLNDLARRIESGEVTIVESKATNILIERACVDGQSRVYEPTGRQEYTIIVDVRR